jgi:membrane protein DedA with SNARE-associated domain
MGFLDGDTVQHLIAHYGYAAIFLVVMLESAGIPMPGETILISAAALAGTKHALEIQWVIAAAAGGAIVGDNFGFWVGREFGEPAGAAEVFADQRRRGKWKDSREDATYQAMVDEAVNLGQEPQQA